MPFTKTSDEWVQVYSGPMAIAELLCDTLRSEGISAEIPNRNQKQLDPLHVGDRSFDFRILVPREQAERALEIVRVPAPGDVEWSAADEVQPPRASPAVLATERLGRRIFWCTSTFLFAPLALWFAFEYFPAARRLERRPAWHRSTVLATFIAAVQTVTLLGIAGARVLEELGRLG